MSAGTPHKDDGEGAIAAEGRNGLGQAGSLSLRCACGHPSIPWLCPRLALLLLAIAHAAIADGVTQESSDTFVIEKTATSYPYSEDGRGGNYNRIKAMLEAAPDGHKVRAKFVTRAPGGTAITYVVMLTPLNAEGQPHGTELHFGDWYTAPIQSVPFKNGQKHGTEQIFRTLSYYNPHTKRHVSNRYVHAEIPWEDDELHGTKKTFHANKKLASEATYVQGVLSGESRTYDDEGRLLRVATYRKGKKHGELFDYWPSNGNVKRVVHYKKGKVHGVAKGFYLSGKPKWVLPFKDNQQHGTETEYEEDGAVIRTRHWRKGEEQTDEEP